MAWGVQTWDDNGVPNNYGIKPTMVLSRVNVSNGQVSGSWSFTIESGYQLRYLQCPFQSVNSASRRRINFSGGTASLSSAASSDYTENTEPAVAGMIIFYQEKI
ncbi:hypothetical protein DK055_14595 [Salmonella enterica subsp. salamae serovar Sofia]|nr:hypothetical protein [Salmonella enterica subsp. salamae serovar Sofia]ECJ2352147.1 hypothetical protein [Salmonella enterica subsp. salamae serovar Sofia]